MSLAWVDRSGKTEMIPAPRRRHYEPRISPDGTMVATATRDDSPDIFVWNLRRGVETRVTLSDARDIAPVWLDDRELVFATEETTGKLDVYRRRADLTTEAALVAKTPDSESPMTMSLDGKTLLVTSYVGGGNFVASFSMEKPGPATPLIGTSYPSTNAVVSPDGHWVAYEAREGDRTEVYVRPFPNVTDGRTQISQGGAGWPVWSRDGKELFFVSSAGGQVERPMMAVPILAARGTTFEPGQAKPLFNMLPYIRSSQRGYDVSLDGSKFVVIVDAGAPTAGTRTVMRYVTNWFEELRARVK
jgi:Tol biopolymer transport system component